MALSSSPLSRRSVAKGVAWTAPVVAIAATAPMAAATKVPPTTVIRFGGACGNTGSDGKGCGGDKTIQVPLTLTNLTGADLVFQVTSMYTCLNKNNTCEEAPTGPGAGVVEGTRGIWTTAVPGQFSQRTPAAHRSTRPAGAARSREASSSRMAQQVPPTGSSPTVWARRAPSGQPSITSG